MMKKQRRFLHNQFAYTFDFTESTSGKQDKNQKSIFENDIILMQGFSKPLVVRFSPQDGFYPECVWHKKLCESEFGTDYEKRLKNLFSQSKPEQLEVVGNTRQDNLRELTQVSTHRGHTIVIMYVQEQKKKYLNAYVLFDKEAFFKIMPAFKDKPGAVNVDGSRNGYGDDFFDASENRSQLYTYEAFDFNVSIPITYAEFGYKADLLQERKCQAFI